MNRVSPAELPTFLRKYRFPGSRVRRVKIGYDRPDVMTVELVVLTRTPVRDLGTNSAPVRLKLKLIGVDEFRFQKRPTMPAGKIPDLRAGYFDGLFFVNLDAFALDPGETPRLHDYRASDAYLAGDALWWEELPGNPKRERGPG